MEYALSTTAAICQFEYLDNIVPRLSFTYQPIKSDLIDVSLSALQLNSNRTLAFCNLSYQIIKLQEELLPDFSLNLSLTLIHSPALFLVFKAYIIKVYSLLEWLSHTI